MWFLDDSIEIDSLLVFAAKSTCYKELPKEAVVNGEIFNLQLCVNGYVRENVMNLNVACSQTCQLDIVKVQQPKYVLQIDAAKVAVKCVDRLIRDAS